MRQEVKFQNLKGIITFSISWISTNGKNNPQNNRSLATNLRIDGEIKIYKSCIYFLTMIILVKSWRIHILTTMVSLHMFFIQDSILGNVSPNIAPRQLQ